MGLLPPPYDTVLTIALLVVDGAIIGVAAKRAVVSAILLIVGLLLATFVGLALPFSLTAGEIITHLTNIFTSQMSHIGNVVSAFPIAWLIGFGLGVWKG